MAIVQWLGGPSGSYNFDTASNWLGGAVPGVGDVAYFGAAQTGPYTITGNATIGEIETNGNSVTLDGAYTMSGLEALELFVSTGALTIASGASITGNSTVQVDSSLTVDGSVTASNLNLVNGGVVTLEFGASVTGEIDLNGGTLGGEATLNDLVEVMANGGTLGSPESLVALNGAISGAGPLSITGAVDFNGSVSRYTGNVTINTSSILNLGDGGVSGSLTGNIADQSSFGIDESGPVTLTGTIFGFGALFQEGTGITTLAADNTYAGGTEISNTGTLAATNGSALGTGPLTIEGGEFLATATEDIANTLSMFDIATIAAAPGQVLTIGGPNPWNFIEGNGGTLTFGAPGEDGTVLWQTPTGSLKNGTAPQLVVADGTLRADDALFYYITYDGAGTTIDAGATIDANGFTTYVNNLQGAGEITDSGGAAPLYLYGGNFAGVIDGPIGIYVEDNTTLTGANIYSQGTQIQPNATLTLGNGGMTGSLPAGSIITIDGTLAIDESDAVTLSAFIRDTDGYQGVLVQEGTGTTTLTDGNSYTGGTTIESGTLELVQSNSAGTGGIAFAGTNATLQIDGTTMPTNLITNFAFGDAIDLANLEATRLTYSAGVLTIFDNSVQVASLKLAVNDVHQLTLAPDGLGGTRIIAAPVTSDFNSDGMSDVPIQNVGGTLADWTMNGPMITAETPLSYEGNVLALPSSYDVAGIGDFNDDGKADILLQNSDGTFTDWTMNGSVIVSSQQLIFQNQVVALGPSWSVAGVGDFNNGGNADILLYNTNGTFTDWTMNGSVITSSQNLTFNSNVVDLPSSYSVAGIGDFSGNDDADILLHNANGTFTDWTMDGSVITTGYQLTYLGNVVALSSAYSVVGIGDFTGDGTSDILLRNTDGSFTDWTMDGSVITSGNQLTFNGSVVHLDASWSVVEVGDFNGDGKADILLQNTNGMLIDWAMNGSVITSGTALTSQGNVANLANTQLIETNPATGGGGTQIVASGSSVINPFIAGNTLDLMNGAIVSGPISFTPGTTGMLLDTDQANLPDTVMGFAEGSDHLSFSGETNASIAAVVAAQQLVNGNTVLTFPDGTSINLVGITHVDTGFFL